MITSPEHSLRSQSSVQLESIVNKYLQQRKEGIRNLSPECHEIDSCTTTDWAIPGNKKYYGKMDTDHMGFTLPDPSKIYLLIVPPETAESWIQQKGATLEPILEKNGDGPSWNMEIDVTFPQQLLKERLDRLLPLANVYGGHVNVLALKQTESGGSKAIMQASGKAYQLRNLERVLKVMGKSLEYAVTKK